VCMGLRHRKTDVVGNVKRRLDDGRNGVMKVRVWIVLKERREKNKRGGWEGEVVLWAVGG
jgi:hypothetical protein